MKTVKNVLKIYHVGRKGKNGGVVTIATKVIAPQTIQVGFAFCSPKDSFNRKLGTKIAIGRIEGLYRPLQTFFSGHSADDVVKLWEFISKPTYWKNKQLHNLPKYGLSFSEKF